MAQTCPDDTKFGFRFSSLGGLAAAKYMCPASPEILDADAAERTYRYAADGTGISGRAPRDHGAEDCPFFIDYRPHLGNVGMERIAIVVRQRENRLSARGSGDTDLGPVAIDVLKAQGSNLTRSASGASGSRIARSRMRAEFQPRLEMAPSISSAEMYRGKPVKRLRDADSTLATGLAGTQSSDSETAGASAALEAPDRHAKRT